MDVVWAVSDKKVYMDRNILHLQCIQQMLEKDIEEPMVFFRRKFQ